MFLCRNGLHWTRSVAEIVGTDALNWVVWLGLIELHTQYQAIAINLQQAVCADGQVIERTCIILAPNNEGCTPISADKDLTLIRGV